MPQPPWVETTSRWQIYHWDHWQAIFNEYFRENFSRECVSVGNPGVGFRYTIDLFLCTLQLIFKVSIHKVRRTMFGLVHR